MSNGEQIVESTKKNVEEAPEGKFKETPENPEKKRKSPGEPEEAEPEIKRRAIRISDDIRNREFLQPQGARRYVVFPVQYPKLRTYYELQRDTFWLTRDIDVGPDRRDFLELRKDHPGIANTLLNVLGFFAASDGLILENLESNFGHDIALIEARQFYAMQEAIEAIHSDMYSILIDRCVESLEERTRLFQSIEQMPAVKAKAAWAKFWIDGHNTVQEKLVAQTAVEGIHFSGSFGFLFWLKEWFPGKLPGLMKSNEFISRDETLHTEFGIALYAHFPVKLPLARIREIYLSALKREIIFQKEIMPANGISGLSVQRMIEHVKYTSNYWFALFQDPRKGTPELLVRNDDGSVPGPLNEVRRISRQTKVNFFEEKNANYNQPNLANQTTDLTTTF